MQKRFGSEALSHQIKKGILQAGAFFYLVGESGFEPLKQDATDLQSAPFGHSGTLPFGAGERNRTINLLITNQLLCQLSYASTLKHDSRRYLEYYNHSICICQGIFLKTPILFEANSAAPIQRASFTKKGREQTGSAPQKSLWVARANQPAPQRCSTTKPTAPLARRRARLLKGKPQAAANAKNPKRKPPLGPKSHPMPPEKPEKTGSPKPPNSK